MHAHGLPGKLVWKTSFRVRDLIPPTFLQYRHSNSRHSNSCSVTLANHLVSLRLSSPFGFDDLDSIPGCNIQPIRHCRLSNPGCTDECSYFILFYFKIKAPPTGAEPAAARTWGARGAQPHALAADWPLPPWLSFARAPVILNLIDPVPPFITHVL